MAQRCIRASKSGIDEMGVGSSLLGEYTLMITSRYRRANVREERPMHESWYRTASFILSRPWLISLL
jgi:hypothetical protein